MPRSDKGSLASARQGVRSRRRGAGLVVAASVIALLGSLPSGAATPRAERWVTRGAYAPVPYTVHAVSCPTTTLCIAVGVTSVGTGLVLRSADGGRTWSAAQLPIETSELGDVSCGSPTMCEATVLDASFSDVQVIGTTDGGIHWHVQTVNSQADLSDVETVKCSTALDCVATGSGNNGEATIILTTDGGENWESISPFGSIDNFGIEGVNCSSSTTCLVTGWQAGQTTSSGVAAKTTDGGITWTQETVPSDVSVIWELACTSATVCEAPAETTTGWEVLGTADGGVTWTEQTVPSGASPLFISCPAALTCFASGFERTAFDSSEGILLTTVDGGTTWTTVPLPTVSADAQGVSCASATTCVVAGASQFDVPQLYHVSGGVASLDPPLVSGVTSLQSISCGAAARCEATGSTLTRRGDVGAILTTASTGSIWAVRAPNANTSVFLANSCPTASVCYAIGVSNGGSSRVIERTTNAGATWKVVTSGEFYSNEISCVTTTSCVVSGGQVRYSSPATSGHFRASSVPKGLFVQAVSCPTVLECVGVAQDQHGRPAVVRSTDGGRAFVQVKAVPKTFTMYEVDCTAASFCVASGSDPRVETDQGGAAIETSVDGGLHWRLSKTPANAPSINALGCLSADSCYVTGITDSAPAVLHSTDRGARWSFVPAPADSRVLYGLSCGHSGCWTLAETANGTYELEALR